MKTPRPAARNLLLTFLLLTFFPLIACSGGGKPDIDRSPLPLFLQAVAAKQNIDIRAYAILSTNPGKRHLLAYDANTGLYKGNIPVPSGKEVEVRVVYIVNDPVTGEEILVARATRTVV